MTKLLSSIIGGALGVTLAASVGIGISAGANKGFNRTDAAGITATYTFTSKSWTATVGEASKNWVSGEDGYGFKNNGIQVTTATSGANGTSPVSYTGVSKIVLTYNTNKSKGAGTFDIQIGNNSSSSVNWAYQSGSNVDGTNAFFTVEKTYSTPQTGKVNITVNTTTNSCYLVSCAITASSETPDESHTYADTITRYATGIAYGSTHYADWSNLQLTSAAVYSGHSAGDKDAVQIRTNSNMSGIVTTASGGTVKSVVVRFNTATTAGRTVSVYGKGSAYEAPSDLFDSSIRGTFAGSAKYESGTTEYTITPESRYSYIGIRSSSGALYLDSITINWETTTAVKSVSSLAVSNNPDSTTFAVGERLDLTGLVVTATYSDSTSGATVNYSTNPKEGYTFNSSDLGAKTITVTSNADSTKTTSFSVNVVNAYPTKLERTTPVIYSSSMKLNEGTGRFKATFTDASVVTDIKVGDADTALFIGGVEVDTNTLATEYINQSATLKYTKNSKTVQYTFKVTINNDLAVDHFDDVPEYVICGETARINANFVSFVGIPTATVTALESDYLSVSYDPSDLTYDEVANTGLIPFDVIAGNEAGQYSVSVTIEVDGKTATNTCCVIVRKTAPGHEGSGEFELVESMSSDMSGKYVIATKYDGEYLSMSASITSNKKMATSHITVENDVITSASTVFDIFELTKNGSGDNYNIVNNNKYVRYSGAGTDLNFEDENTPYAWTISLSDSGLGTFRFTASSTAQESTVRALAYHAPDTQSANNVFGPYGISNFSAKASMYYSEIELFRYTGSEEEDTGATEFELVKTFVDTYMHMDDISISDTSDTGACRGEGGYYLTAKAAWNAMSSSYTGDHDLRALFEEKFPDAYERYITWAEKNGDTQPFTGSTIVKASSSTSFLTDNSGALSITVISLAIVGITTLGGYFFLRKKKEM